VLYLGKKKLSSAENGQTKVTSFEYHDGNVMTLQDEGCTLILLTDISFSSCTVSSAAPIAKPVDAESMATELMGAESVASMCSSSRTGISDFSSQEKMKAVGWRLEPDTWPSAHDTWCGHYNTKASIYCGYQYHHRKQAIMLTLSGSGSATVTYRNDYHGRDCGGSVVLYLGKKELSSAANGQAKETTFTYKDGDVMTLQDEGCTVILLTDISFSSCNTGDGSLSAADGGTVSTISVLPYGASADNEKGVWSNTHPVVQHTLIVALIVCLIVIAALIARLCTRKRDVVGVVAIEVPEVQALQNVELDDSAVTVQGMLPTDLPHTLKATVVRFPGSANV